MWRRLNCILILVGTVCDAFGVWGQSTSGAAAPVRQESFERGLPILQSWTARDYRSHHEVVSVTEAPDGAMLFASLASVLEYDGHAWTKHPVPGSWLKQLATDADGFVYVAADNEFGRLEPRETGGRTYRSFTGLTPDNLRPLGVVRTVLARADGVYFAAQTAVFRWRDGRLEAWPIEGGRQMFLLSDGEALYLSNPAKGLHRFDGTGWPVVSEAPEFQRNGRVSMARLRDGTVLVGFYRDGLQRWDGARLVPWANEASELLRTALVTDLSVLPDGSVAVGTGTAGLVVLGVDGRLVDRIDQPRGLSNDTVFDATVDRDGAVWMGTRNGVVRWDPGLPVTRFDARLGFPEASVQEMTRHRDRIYATIAGVGVFQLVPAANRADTGRFEALTLPAKNIYGIASHESGLLIGSDAGVLRWNGRTAEVAARPAGNVKQLLVSRRDGALVFAGTESALFLYRVEGGRWTALKEWKTGGEVLRLAQDPDGTVWAGVSSLGFVRVPYPSATESWEAVTPKTYDHRRGFVGGESIFHVITGPSGALFVTDRSAYRFEAAGDRFVVEDRFVIDGQRDVFFGPQAASGDGWIWGGATRRGTTDMYSMEWPFGAFRPVAAGGFEWVPAPASWIALVGAQGAFNTFAEGTSTTGAVWVATESALLRVSPCDPSIRKRPLPVQLRGPAVAGNPVRTEAGVSRLKYTRDAVGFEYSVARTDLGAGVRFQTRLVGFNDQWSALTASRSNAYSGLTGGPFTFEVRAVDADGTVGEVSRATFEVAAPWYRSGRALAGYALLGLLTVQGVVRWRVRRLEMRRRELEELVTVRTRELAEARDVAEEASRAKSRFLANMSHELRTPLNAVLGFSQLLSREEGLSDRNRERLRLVQSSGDHLLGLINDVLDLSKVEAGRVELRLQPFDLAALLRDVEATFASRAAQRGLEWRVEVRGASPGRVMGDAQRLRQVLDNLVGNALKFTRAGAVRLEVVQETAGIQFAVVDTGAGMSTEDIGRLFQPFSQVVNGRPPEPGAGLGLSISQHLVGLMGGRIEVESEPGAGSRFAFRVALPVVSGVETGIARPGTIRGYEGGRRRVLLVDDLEANRRLLREYLEPVGFEVTEADSGVAALGHLRAQSAAPDLVILDLRMPGMDGFELTRAIRSTKWNPAAPRIVATSASVFAFSRDDALALGCDDFLPKPFKEEALFELLGRVLTVVWVRDPRATTVTGPATNGGVAAARSVSSTLTPVRMQALVAAANRGDVAALKAELAALRESNPGATAVLDELEAMAKTFQMAALRRRLAELQARRTGPAD